MKKSILILTDLSENARYAAEAGLTVAGRLGANLLLLNCNTIVSAVGYYPITPILSELPNWYDDQESGLKELSKHLRKKYSEAFPGGAKMNITAIIKEGDLNSNVKDVLKHHRVEMIIMGARSGTPTEHFLFGSDTKAIVDHSSVPVMVVPPSASVRATLQIVFATTFLEQDIFALNYLAQLREKLGAHLEIVHIRQYGQVPDTRNRQVQYAIEQHCKDNPNLFIYNEVYGKHVVSRLNHYCKEANADILALSHQHHSSLFRTFREGVVDKSLTSQKIPLLILPELKSDSEADQETFKGLSNIVF